MTSLKKRSTAVIIAVAVIIIGTLIGVHRSVGSETAKIEAQFYKGVYLTDEKYLQPSIQLQLDNRATAALGLETIASNYGDLKEQTEAFHNARRELVSTPSIEIKYQANEKMQAAYEKLYAALIQRGLKDNEKAAVANYAKTLDGAQGIIEKSSYNKVVKNFKENILGAFPVNIIKNLAFVDYPVYFGPQS